ncbi:MAG: cysteine desulfurase NifS [Methanosarcinaceae archaeon]|nr:cysteine desulfurase NifS [Methanosarcinaceae archaeon]
MKPIYMDHGSTTAVDPDVVRAMTPYFTEIFGNASSLHSYGEQATVGLNASRQIVASAIGAHPDEIIFTSGGTESDNLAIKGIAYRNQDRGRHIITSNIEHPAVLNTCAYLEKHGFEVTYVPVNDRGLLDVESVKEAVRDDTILITVMHANNEIGTIQPIEEICILARDKGIYVHTDAVQSIGKVPIDVNRIGVDLLSISSHKIYGPKGVGALYIRKGTNIEAISHGGSHERGIRAGTENISGIVGFARAMELAQARFDGDCEHLRSLRDRMIGNILKSIDHSYLNGDLEQRLVNNVNIRFSYVEGEAMLLLLNNKGIAVSTGSACSSKSLKPSHVLEALGLAPEEMHGSLRITLGRENTEAEADRVVEALIEIIGKLRAMSPLA